MRIKSLLVSLVVLLSSAVYAAEVQYFTTINECLSTGEAMFVIESRFKEQPFVIGTGIVKSAYDLEYREGLMVMYVNLDSSTYTVIINFATDDMSCILITGEQFQPAPDPSEKVDL